MCRKLIEAMGSTLQYETKAGWGTRFFFELELPPATHL
jgi:signal transduction histidine kinase